MIVAWLSLIGVLAAGIGYVYLSEPLPQIAAVPEAPGHSDPAEESASGHDETAQADGHGSDTHEAESQEAESHADESEHSLAGNTEQASEHGATGEVPGKLVAGGEPEVKQDSTPSEEHAAEKEAQDTPKRDHATSQAATEATVAQKAPVDQTTSEDPDNAPTKAAQTASADGHGDQAHSNTEAGSEKPGHRSADHETSAGHTAEDGHSSGQAESVQQAALPKVAAPDHNSLPLWQRNRQQIDRRWLKDSAGNPKPRIAFILSELGHARTAAEEIIKKLPPAITLSFSPYANPRSLEYLSALARSNGHEVMLDLPLEPIDFPQRDPGPKALLTALEPKQNLERLDWSLNRSTGYVGVAVWMGSRFVASPRQMRPLMEAIHDRGLLYLDNAEREDSLGPSLAGELSIPTVTSHRYVDVPLASRDAIDARLAQVERIALQFGSAVAMGRPFPVTVERLAEWSAEIEKRGIVLVPITVLAEESARRQNLAEKTKAAESKAQATSSGTNSNSH